MTKKVKLFTPNWPGLALIKEILAGVFLIVLMPCPSPAATIMFSGVISNNASGTFTNEVIHWRTLSQPKSMDIDSNNLYGSFGADIWGDGANHGSGGAVISAGTYLLSGTNNSGTLSWSFVGQAVDPDLGIGLASFSKSTYVQIDNLAGSALLFPAVSSISAGSGNVTIQFNGPAGAYSNRVVRLGMMMDYQEPTATMDGNKLVTVTQTADVGGGAASTTTLPFNEIPDILFFDINNINPSDQITVTCYASADGTGPWALASLGTMCFDLSPAGVVVTNAPTITSGPNVTPSTIIPSGGSFTLSVSASGSVPLTYRWRKAGVEVTNTGTVASATFHNVFTNLSGNYDAVVTNIVGAVTSSVVRARQGITFTACVSDWDG